MTIRELSRAFVQAHQALLDSGLEYAGVGCEPFPENEDLDQVDPAQCTVYVVHPYIFDTRRIPKEFNGMRVLRAFSGCRSDVPLSHPAFFPPEFGEQPLDDKTPYYTYLAPAKYEAFVDRCADELRQLLKDPSLTRPQLLDLLAFGDFETHRQACRRLELEAVQN